MKLSIIRGVAAVTLGGVALVTSAPAKADSVVVQPPAQPAPAPAAPAPAPAPASPQTVVVQPGVTQAQPSGPTVVEPAAPPPPAETAMHPETRPNRTLLMTGLVLFGAPYVASMGIAATSPHPGDSNLWVPVAGPWIDLGQRGGCNGDCGNETGNKVLLVGDGILQTIGALQIVGAFVFPETIALPNTAKLGPATVSFTPSKVGRDGYGLSAVGHF